MVRGRVGRSATTEGASQANGPGEQIPIRLEGSLSKEEAAVLHEREEPGHLTVEVGKVLENIAHVEDVCKPTLVECLVCPATRGPMRVWPDPRSFQAPS